MFKSLPFIYTLMIIKGVTWKENLKPFEKIYLTWLHKFCYQEVMYDCVIYNKAFINIFRSVFIQFNLSVILTSDPRTQAVHMMTGNKYISDVTTFRIWSPGPLCQYLKKYHRKISWSRVIGIWIIASFWNLAGTSTTPLCQPNCRAIVQF